MLYGGSVLFFDMLAATVKQMQGEGHGIHRA